jgi:hypothetical protein
MCIDQNPFNYGNFLPVPEPTYIGLEIQQRTKYLLEIWRAIGDNSPLPGSLQQDVKDKVLGNLLNLINEVFPEQESGVINGGKALDSFLKDNPILSNPLIPIWLGKEY